MTRGRDSAMDIAMIALGTDHVGHAALLADCLGHAGHRVSLYTTVPITAPLPAGSRSVVTRDLAGFAGSGAAPDVVHTLTPASVRAVAGAGSVGVPVVHTHGLGERVSALPRGVVDHLVVNSAAAVATLAREGVPRSAVSVVPEGVDLREWSAEGPVASRTASPRLVYRGELRPGDGTDTAVAALPRVPGAELLVTAEPASDRDRDRVRREVDRLRAGAAALGVADRIRVVTGVDAGLLRSADVVVHAPWTTRSVRPVLEAMACGVPVVAGAVGALPETVLDEVTGVLVPPRDPRALAAAVRRLLADKTRLAAFATAAVDRVEQRHTRGRIAVGTTAVYRALIGARATPA